MAANSGAEAAEPDVSPNVCWANIPVPAVGAMGPETVMRGGALNGPVIINGKESSDIVAYEVVVRGGYLKSPHIFGDLQVVGDRPFIKLQKWHHGLCMYLTGKHKSSHPLKEVPAFEDMQQKMIEHCSGLMAQKTQELRGSGLRPLKVRWLSSWGRPRQYVNRAKEVISRGHCSRCQNMGWLTCPRPKQIGIPGVYW